MQTLVQYSFELMSNVLLCISGNSPMVVPEAWLAGGSDYDQTYVVTSNSTDSPNEGINDFFSSRADIKLHFYRVEGFERLLEEKEHVLFLEALQRIYLYAREKAQGGRLDVCLTGGFKTMSAALQRSARLLGADSIFHVLCDENPDTPDQVIRSWEKGKIRKIELGSESGHRLLDNLSSKEFPIIASALGMNEFLSHKGTPPLLSDEINRRESILRRRGDPDSPIGALPFRCLGFLSDDILDWLNQPLDSQTDAEWVRSLPKVELHSHLGGFATHGELLARVRSSAIHPDDLPDLNEPVVPDDWPFPSKPISLSDYMALGDATGSTLLKDPGCLRAHIRLLIEHLSDDRIHYAEIRCSPVNYASEKLERAPLDIVADIRSAILEVQSELEQKDRIVPQIGLIIIVNRSRSGDLSRITEHIALATTLAGFKTGEVAPVVGIDLAGYENPDTRPAYFQEDFEPVHRKGLAVTVHAGENDDPESIWQAVYKLSARRIGHGLNLLDAPHLLRAVADRGIGIELCPFANCQIKGFSPMPELDSRKYPLLPYLTKGIKATVNVDNIGISAASLSDNLLLLPKIAPGVSRLDVLFLLRNAIDICFLPVREKPILRERIEVELASLFSKRIS